MLPKQIVFLVVDDFESMRLMIVNQLRSFGILTILKATNGAEALQILREERVDFILSDWNMPVMTGIDLLKAVRSDEKLRNLPFIMITAEAKREQLSDVINSGVSDLLLKPYTVSRLHEKIVKGLTWKPRESVMEIQEPSPLVTEIAPTKEKRPSRSTILVVDDSPDNLRIIANLFRTDYNVRVANSGEKGLEIIQSDNPPDLVLLDIMMPGLDGFTVFKNMREHPNSEHIPVIFVTALAGEEAFMRGLEMGAIDFVTKPINPDLLKIRVRNFMQHVELYRRLQDDYDLMIETAKLRNDVEHIIRHDIKGPLAGVISLVQDLVTDNTLNDRQAGQLRIVEETVLQALNIINLSSELFKIETGRFQLNPQPIKITEILRRTTDILRATFSGKHINIDVIEEVRKGGEVLQAYGDPMLCYSLFQNLIKNACEAAPADTTVTIKLVDKDPLRIDIRNKGAVPAAIRERFFDKFVTHGKQGGTGLGTYSAKLLTEAQYGKIEMATSDSEDETVITITLPRTL
jgi:two-component system, sensor histidine kinase and response regulator